MTPQKLAFIDSLRGIAATYVALYHFSLITNPNAVAPQWLAPFTGLGGSGVTLFFVISAFTLCLSMDSRKTDETKPIRNYLIRRFFRIAPLFYFWIAIFLVRDFIVFGASHSLGQILRSVFFIINFFPGQEQGFVWASWTLGVEMLFYLIFPAIFIRLTSVGSAVAAFLLLRQFWHIISTKLITDPAVAETYYSFSFLTHLPTFLLGIVLYRIYSRVYLSNSNHYGVGSALIAGSLTWLLGLAYGFVNTGQLDPLTAQALIFAGLALGLSMTPWKFLVNAISGFLGKISYSIYLSHTTIFYFMSGIFRKIYETSPYVTVAYILSLSLGMGAVLLFSWCTYKFIEIPGQNLGRKLISH
jgi:peptidoglycan/LPS O-acetylase OafA/YrhL